MNIDGRNPRERVFIVAEIGNNHEGSFTLAEELVGRAAESGADAVKFQTSDPDRFVAHTETARLERLKQFRLSPEQIASLAALARRCGVVFFSTPLDLDTARFLNTLQPVFKVASGDNTFFPLIDLLASFGKPLIISTGLADLVLLDDLQARVRRQWGGGGDPALAFLHCVASYPVPAEQVNLTAIRTMAMRFPDVVIGYSDHTLGIEASVGAVAVGARIVEKHFTLNHAQSDFRDHQLSAEPAEFRRLVEAVRTLEPMLGSGEKAPQPSEEGLRVAVRRSIAASRDLPAGATITPGDLMWVRPGTGLAPGRETELVGRVTVRPLARGAILAVSDVEVP